MLRRTRNCLLSSALLLGLSVPLGAAQATGYKFQVLKTFDGGGSRAGVVADPSGNLYGTQYSGGHLGYGDVFELAPDGTFTDIHDFSGGADGDDPGGDLVTDQSGDLFGTTAGTGSAGDYGTVFEIAVDGTYTVLHDFAGGNDGADPQAGLIIDSAGDLYGTTWQGGSSNAGTVFKIAPDGTETILYAFTGKTDGGQPYSRPIADPAGNLYGTTRNFGSSKGCGTVFRLAASGALTTLHVFGKKDSLGEKDGCNPVAGLVADAAGNFYGTTQNGGSSKNYGTVFRLTPDGTETVLRAFKNGGKFGANPRAVPTIDPSGNLYGTTVFGGKYGSGVVFEVAADGTFSLLYSLNPADSDGPYPESDLMLDQAGNLYGTTNGGYDNGYFISGTVFELTPPTPRVR